MQMRKQSFTALCAGIASQAALMEHHWRTNGNPDETRANLEELHRLLKLACSGLEEPTESEVAELVDIGYTRSAALYELYMRQHDGSDVAA
jgi:hypothetical protein